MTLEQDADRMRPTTVLVVDDSTAIRRIIRRALEHAGYLVEEAADGRDAIDTCRSLQPDLVLLDVDMPVMDGMAALREMRADPSVSSIPVLFLTARTGGADVACGLGLGAQDYLRKPCAPVELVARVAAALRLSERERGLAMKAREADEASTMDPLTGLGNRRRLDSRTSEMAIAAPDALVGVIIIDVDHFKRVNDEHGHPAGDAVLRILARRLAGAVPEDVALVRWGGEEFLALVPSLTGAGLSALGERLRAAVLSEPFSVGVLHMVVTVSAGCASGPLAHFDEVLKAADEALYDAKSSGRNRVVLASA